MSDETAVHDVDEGDKADSRAKLSEVFRQYFGTEHGVELPPRARYGCRPLDLNEEEEA